MSNNSNHPSPNPNFDFHTIQRYILVDYSLLEAVIVVIGIYICLVFLTVEIVKFVHSVRLFNGDSGYRQEEEPSKLSNFDDGVKRKPQNGRGSEEGFPSQEEWEGKSTIPHTEAANKTTDLESLLFPS